MSTQCPLWTTRPRTHRARRAEGAGILLSSAWGCSAVGPCCVFSEDVRVSSSVRAAPGVGPGGSAAAGSGGAYRSWDSTAEWLMTQAHLVPLRSPASMWAGGSHQRLPAGTLASPRLWRVSILAPGPLPAQPPLTLHSGLLPPLRRVPGGQVRSQGKPGSCPHLEAFPQSELPVLGPGAPPVAPQSAHFIFLCSAVQRGFCASVDTA